MASGALAPTCAWVEGGGGGTPGFQPVTSPASESKMNRAGPLESPEWTTNPDVGLKTCAVPRPRASALRSQPSRCEPGRGGDVATSAMLPPCRVDGPCHCPTDGSSSWA